MTETSPIPPPPRRVFVDRQIAAVLFAITLLLYARSFGYGFIAFDDPTYLGLNPNLHLGFTAAGLRWAFSTLYFANWHPLVWVVYLADRSLFHLAAAPLHVFNTTCHAATAAMFFLLLRRMTGSQWRSATAAALFAWHPLRVESVVWISETKDVMAGLFWVLTLLVYSGYVTRPGSARYLAVLAAFALALMSKPSVVTLPGVLLLLDAWPLGRLRTIAELRTRLVEKLPLLAMAAAASVLYLRAQRAGGAILSSTAFPPTLRLKNAILATDHYLLDSFWPTKLCIFYPHPALIGQTISPRLMLASAMGLVAFTLIAIFARRTTPYVLVGWLWFLGTLVPMSGILAQAGDQSRADRYTYLPAMGLTIAIVWVAADCLGRLVRSQQPRRALLTALAAAAGVALISITSLQIRTWRNTRALFEHADRVTDRNFFAKAVLAEQFTQDRQYAAAVLYGQAAVDICPQLPITHAALGAVLLKVGRFREACVQLRQAARLDPSDARIRDDLGSAFLDLNRPDDAILQFEKAVRLDPHLAEARNNWAVLLASRGELAAAIVQWEKATELDPSFGAAHELLASALQQIGQKRAAITHYRAALADGERRPVWLTNFAWLVATSPDSNSVDIAEAVTAAAEAVASCGPRPDPLALDALAAAEARDGQFDRATAHAADAIRVLGAQQHELAAAISDRLRLYRNGQYFVTKS